MPDHPRRHRRSRSSTRGGWLTLVITAVVIGLCYLIAGHYRQVGKGVRELDDMLTNLPPAAPMNTAPADREETTAIQLVNGYNGFGVHTMLTVIRSFPGLYKNFVFVSVAEVDVSSFKESDAVEPAEPRRPGDSLQKYVDMARRLGFPAESRFDLGIDIVETASTSASRSPGNSRSRPCSPARPSSAGPASSTGSSTTRRPSPSSRSSAGRAS